MSVGKPKLRRRNSAYGFKEFEDQVIFTNRAKDAEFNTNDDKIEKNNFRAMIDDMKMWKQKMSTLKPIEYSRAATNEIQKGRFGLPQSVAIHGLERTIPSHENLSSNSFYQNVDQSLNARKHINVVSDQKKNLRKQLTLKPEIVIEQEDNPKINKIDIQSIKKQPTYQNIEASDSQSPDLDTSREANRMHPNIIENLKTNESIKPSNTNKKTLETNKPSESVSTQNKKVLNNQFKVSNKESLNNSSNDITSLKGIDSPNFKRVDLNAVDHDKMEKDAELYEELNMKRKAEKLKLM